MPAKIPFYLLRVLYSIQDLIRAAVQTIAPSMPHTVHRTKRCLHTARTPYIVHPKPLFGNSIIVLLLAFPCLAFAQLDTLYSDWNRTNLPEATPTEVQLSLQVVDMRGKPVTELDLWLAQKNNNAVYYAQTDPYGKVYLLLPRGKTFSVSTIDEAGFDEIRTIDRPYVRSRLVIGYSPKTYTEIVRGDTIFQEVPADQMPTHSRILLKLTVTDFDEQPHEAEQLYFTYKNRPEVYVATTNAEGLALLMLPKGDSLFMHTLFEKNITDFFFPNDKRAGTLRLRYRTIGTKAILAREAERKRQAAIRDSLAELARVRDSLDFLKGTTEGRSLLGMYRWGASYDQVEAALKEVAIKTKQALEAEPKYFEQAGHEINAAMYRHKELWADKVIVSDLTGSMYPHLDQILLWHALAIVPGEHNRYIFFNDGDGKPTAEKIIGATGGLYHCEERDMEKILQVMKTTMDAGGGGESPENDVEALLEATRMLGEGDELILLADNYSDVRDLELLAQLHIPVRIVLAGVEHGVNEDYLHLAYMTGGSIHTLEEDIFHLTRLNDGETISIGRYQYRVNGGAFIQMKD